jgi:hypothetical protein
MNKKKKSEKEINRLTTYCLFSGRHKLPENQGPLFLEFDFKEFRGVKTSQYFDAIQKIGSGEIVEVIVTGLTPALTEFIADMITFNKEGSLNLLHYTSQTESYNRQKVF